MARKPAAKKPAKKQASKKPPARRIQDVKPPGVEHDPSQDPNWDQRSRPTKLKPEFIEIAMRMCKLGATDEDLAEAFNVGVRTIYRWKFQSEDFRQATKLGKEENDLAVERSLFEKAMGYTIDSEKIFQHNGKVIRAKYREKVAPDTAAAIFWLCNRQPEKWKQTSRIEHSGPDNGPIETRDVSDIEQARRIAFAMQRTIARKDAETVEAETVPPSEVSRGDEAG